MLGEHLETGLAVGLHDVHGFDLRFDIVTNNGRLLAYEFSRGDNAIVLKRQVAHIGQDMKALALGHENRGRIQQSGLDAAAAQCRQSFRSAATARIETSLLGLRPSFFSASWVAVKEAPVNPETPTMPPFSCSPSLILGKLTSQ